jgi:hypothetical protein
MNLMDIRIVDLDNSVYDKETSNPKKGEYVFSSKRYVTYKGDGPRPNWFFTWERYEPTNGYREVSAAKANRFTFVNVDADKYWPEGVAPDAEGKYVFGDAVLMKCPLVDELERRFKNQELSKNGGKQGMESFSNTVRHDGGVPTGDILQGL